MNLQILLHDSQKARIHAQQIIRGTNKMLAFIVRELRFFGQSLVRPYLKYCVKYWSPYLIQRRFVGQGRLFYDDILARWACVCCS